jgi:hypothetical protein
MERNMEKNTRLIDILPPKKKSLPEKTPKARRQKPTKSKSPRALILLVLFVLLLGGGALSLQIFFAKANVLIWPHLRKVELQERIEAKTSEELVSLAQSAVPAKLFEKEKSLTRLFPASGSKVVETKASGTLTIFNKRDVPQILVANTRFISEEGRLFRLDQRVTVPASSGAVPSSLEVSVAAAEGGEEYNIGPSNFSLPGLVGSPLYTLVYGKSEKTMSGGSKKTQAIVTKSDIENVRELLVSDATTSAKEAVLSSIPATYTVSDESVTTRVLEASTPVKEGAALEQFTFTAKVRAQAFVFQQSDLEKLSREFLAQNLKAEERIHEKTFRAVYTVRAIDMKAGVISLEGDVEASVYLEPSFSELQSSLAGKQKGEVEALLLANPAVARFKLSFWPFWMTVIPQDSNRLDVSLELDPVRD